MGAGERDNPYGFGTGIDQGAGCGSRGGSGGEDVVNEKNVAAGYARGICDGEGAPHIEAALTRRKTGLTLGRAYTHEQTGIEREGEMPGQVGGAQGANGFSGQKQRLIETTIEMLDAMQRNGNNEQILGGVCGKSRDCKGDATSEFACGRAKTVVFERVDQLAHAAVVGSVGHGSAERRGSHAANAAKRWIC